MQITLTPRAFFRSLIIWALVAFFIIGGVGNIFPPPAVQADYNRWGYPGWFHYITGILELTTAILIARETTRRIGAMLGGSVMASALVTLGINAELLHAAAPAAVLLLLSLCLLLDAKAREARWEGKVF
jgi:uncharacterized membrane protein YphA (DoxX/SURF4 family)